MEQVHASACIDPQAKLSEGVRIGPFCVLGPDAELADAVDRLLSDPAARAAQLADCRAAVSLVKAGPERAALLAAREALAEIARG